MVDEVKINNLQPWHKEISKDFFMAEVEKGNRFVVGFNKNLNKYYKVDFEHPDYIKHRKEAVEKKEAFKNIKKEMLQRRLAIALKKGKILGVREYKKSERFKKVLEKQYKKGLKDGRPKLSIEERIRKKEEKATALLNEAKKLRQK